MNSKRIYVLITLAAVCVLCTGWADNWEGIKKGAETVKSIRADFVQEKHMKILARPFVSKGVLLYRIPGALRWEYTEPVKSVLLMLDGKTNRFIEGKEGLVEDKGAGLYAMQFVMQEITRWFSGRFDENPDFKATLASDGRIVLRPRKETMAGIIARIELAMSERPGIIRSVEIYENEETFTRIIFQNVQPNVRLPDEIFQEIR
jgi:outer membrane lipoprotein-sorting protein